MRRSSFVLSLGFLAFLGGAPRVQAADVDTVDYDLAYSLATASYCAYAVGELDYRVANAQQNDAGAKHAFECLEAAAKADDRLRDLKPQSLDKVEAYYNPLRSQDAYLLIRAKMGVILAFRGTLTPPFSPSEASHRTGVGDRIGRIFRRGAVTFISDWINNFFAATLGQAVGVGAPGQRHFGFDSSWQPLMRHLESPCKSGGGAADCSKFDDFIKEIESSGENQPLYVTGHSKGGALAILAGYDLGSKRNNGSKTVVYTFAAAKAFSKEGVAHLTEPTKEFWRFEHSGDIVPSLPPDESFHVMGLPPFEHVGSLTYFGNGEKVAVAPSTPKATDAELDDKKRFSEFYGIRENIIDVLSFPLLAGKKTLDDCSPVRDHFAVFSSVQRQAWSRGGVTGGNDFFAKGLRDGENKEILWGYNDWCDYIGSLPLVGFFRLF